MIELDQKCHLDSVDCGHVADHQLLRQQINNLTLKKRNSKKSTMSEKQVIARRKLALELKDERKIQPNIATTSTDTTTSNTTVLTTNSNCSRFLPQNRRNLNSRSSVSGSSRSSDSSGTGTDRDRFEAVMPDEEVDNINRCADGINRHAADCLDVKVKQDCLERLRMLQKKLERRLYEYEFLVAQERSLLKSHNKTLFLSKGINNFQYRQALQNQFLTKERSPASSSTPMLKQPDDDDDAHDVQDIVTPTTLTIITKL